MEKNSSKGFTLVELLVVIAIIGILVAIAVVAINPVRQIQNARDSRMRADLQQVKASMQLYYNDCKFYPTQTQFDGRAGLIWADLDTGNNSCDSSNTYMRQVPRPTSSTTYIYTTTSGCNNTGTSCVNYVLGADLNNPNADDNASTTKCSAAATSTTANSGEHKVCND